MVNNNQKQEQVEETLGKQETPLQQEEIQTLSRDNYINAVGMGFDFEHANRYWEVKHGIIETPMLLNERGSNKRYDNRKWKAIIQNDKFLNLVGRYYVTFPNEEVIDIAYKLIKDDPSLRILGEPKFTNHGLNMFLTIVSDKHQMVVEGSHVKDDTVNLGLQIRNSIGGDLALGVDIFTYRTICQNGAVFGYEDIGSDFMRHFGKDTPKITENMRQLITNGLGRFEDIHQFYQKMVDKKLGDANRKSIFKKLEPLLAQKYFPDYVEVERIKVNKDQPADKVYHITKESQNYSMWRVFNDMTQKVWHAKDLRMEAKRWATINLHKIVINSLKDSKVN